jgi:hypothetical protein
MVIQTDTLTETDIDAILFWNCVDVRDAEDAHTTTTGSVSDLPYIDQGTDVWRAWDDDVFYTLQNKSSDYGDLGTGPSILYTKMRLRGPSPFESIFVLDHVMVRLKRAADAGDERAFLRVENSINWETRLPEDVLYGVQLALAAGAHLAARRIASRGASRFPNDEEIRKYARVLSPPKVVKEEASARSDLRANRDWLQVHRNEYQGKWVALHNGQLFGTAPTLAKLKDYIDSNEGVFFIKVY